MENSYKDYINEVIVPSLSNENMSYLFRHLTPRIGELGQVYMHCPTCYKPNSLHYLNTGTVNCVECGPIDLIQSLIQYRQWSDYQAVCYLAKVTKNQPPKKIENQSSRRPIVQTIINELHVTQDDTYLTRLGFRTEELKTLPLIKVTDYLGDVAKLEKLVGKVPKPIVDQLRDLDIGVPTLVLTYFKKFTVFPINCSTLKSYTYRGSEESSTMFVTDDPYFFAIAKHYKLPSAMVSGYPAIERFLSRQKSDVNLVGTWCIEDNYSIANEFEEFSINHFYEWHSSRVPGCYSRLRESILCV
ncbi:hypothetical protein [Vibrio owensii]|uniref:hypothetical protein n=1 Tax=Vibrio owensii TaxID=696485 RepID=UPI0040680497